MIRAILGFLLVFGAVGGMDAQPLASNAVFAAQIISAVIGLVLLHFGIKKMTQE